MGPLAAPATTIFGIAPTSRGGRRCAVTRTSKTRCGSRPVHACQDTLAFERSRVQPGASRWFGFLDVGRAMCPHCLQPPRPCPRPRPHPPTSTATLPSAVPVRPRQGDHREQLLPQAGRQPRQGGEPAAGQAGRGSAGVTAQQHACQLDCAVHACRIRKLPCAAPCQELLLPGVFSCFSQESHASAGKDTRIFR